MATDILSLPRVESASAQRVLRNTYALLALSMVPTLLGAMLGHKLNFALFAHSPVMSLVVFMAVSIGFMWGIQKNRNNSLGVALLLGFTFFMGLMLARIIGFALGFANGASILAMTAGGTALTFGVMAAVASTSRRDFSGMGTFLFVGLIIALLASIANIFLQMPVLQLAIAAVMTMISAAYMLYDVNRIVRGGETSYVSAALAIYLDIYNFFVSLLQLLLAFTGERD